MKIGARLAGTAILGLAVATATHATTADAPKSLTVRFADLDLRKTEGAAILFHRIRKAAQQVCQTTTSESYRKRQRERACFERAVMDAVTHIDSPVLKRYVASQSLPDGQPRPPVVALR